MELWKNSNDFHGLLSFQCKIELSILGITNNACDHNTCGKKGKRKLIINQQISSGGSRGKPPYRPNFFQFHAVIFLGGKIVCWRPPAPEGPTGNPTSAACVLFETRKSSGRLTQHQRYRCTAQNVTVVH